MKNYVYENTNDLESFNSFNLLSPAPTIVAVLNCMMIDIDINIILYCYRWNWSTNPTKVRTKYDGLFGTGPRLCATILFEFGNHRDDHRTCPPYVTNYEHIYRMSGWTDDWQCDCDKKGNIHFFSNRKMSQTKTSYRK